MNLSNENIIHVKRDNIEFLQFKKLLEYETINHCYTLKTNNMNFRSYHDGTNEQKDNLLNNYEKICNQLHLNYSKLIKPYQMHTSIVQNVYTDNFSGPDIYTKNYLDTDGLITSYSNIPLATTNADCILMLLYDPVKKVIGNIHSGWRGTANKIILNAINLMIDKYNSNPQDIICCICPSIRVCHFEVDEDVKELFENSFKEYLSYDFIKIGRKIDNIQKYNIDTILLNKLMLKSAGLLDKNIIDSEICSVCNHELIHSRRADGENFGLGTAIIEMK